MKLKHTKVATLAATLITFESLAGGVKAATVVEYDLDSSNAASSSTVTTSTVAPGIGASLISSTGLSAPFNVGGTFAYSDWGTTIDLGKFFAFALTPDPGSSISYNTISYNTAATGVGASWELRSSLDSFATAIDSFTMAAGTAPRNSIDISSLGITSSAVEFRFYVAASNAGQIVGFAGTTFGGGPEPIIDGTIMTVPEPTSALLLGLGTLGLVTRRRRIV